MSNQTIIIIAIFIAYYHVGGLATTNILRLTKGNTLPILSSKCACDNCGSKISLFFQFPIISYLICKGKCRNCGVKIPVFGLVLELVVFLGMCGISTIFNFSMWGVLFSFVYYEVVRIAVVLVRGKRAENFSREYLIAMAMCFLHFLLIGFMAFIGTIV